MTEKEILEIKRDLLKEISKGLVKKIKMLQKELKEERSTAFYFDQSLNTKEDAINVYIKEKIRFEKWSKMLNHKIEKL